MKCGYIKEHILSLNEIIAIDLNLFIKQY